MTTAEKKIDEITGLPDGLEANLVLDDAPMNPRNESVLFTISAKDQTLADDHAVSADSEREFFLRLACTVDTDFQMKLEEAHYEYIGTGVGMYDYVDDYPEELVEEAQNIAHSHYYVRPLYVYKHGQTALSTGPFSSSWDAGHGGYIYVDRADLDECPDRYDDPRDWADKIISGELDRFQSYINGNVYGYRLREKVAEGVEGALVDSCYGFYDREFCEEECRRVAESYAEDL